VVGLVYVDVAPKAGKLAPITDLDSEGVTVSELNVMSVVTERVVVVEALTVVVNSPLPSVTIAG
jgi:hypothetical protein